MTEQLNWTDWTDLLFSTTNLITVILPRIGPEASHKKRNQNWKHWKQATKREVGTLREKKRITRLEMPFPSGGFKISNKQYWNAKIGSQEIPGVTGKLCIGVQNEAGQRLTDYCQENALVIANSPFQQHKRSLYRWTSPDGQYQYQIDYILCSQRWRSSI